MRDLHRLDETTDIPHLPEVTLDGHKENVPVRTALRKAENVPLEKA